MRAHWSLARQLMVLQAAVVVLVVALAAALAYADARRDAREAAVQRTVAVAEAVADSPDVHAAVGLDDPTSALQPYAEQVRADTRTDFVVVMSTAGTRWSHPDPELIGEPFIGTTGPALRGETFSETYTGTLGPSVRTVAPVRGGPGGAGEVVALVAVGITVDRVGADLRRQLPALVLAVLAVLALAAGGTWLIARRLRRQTFDLGPAELARMYGYYDAVLHSVREGLLLLDADGRLQLANEEAERLLALPDDARGRPVGDLGLPGDLVAALTRPEPVVDELLVARDRVVAVNVAVVDGEHGQPPGRVVTLRDRTDLQRLTGELDTTRGLAEALRSAQHEAANRLHTVVALVELGRPEDAVQFAVGELAAAQSLTDSVVAAVEEPVVAALLLGKSAVAAERGVELVLEDGTAVDDDVLAAAGLAPRDLVTVLGNLVDNALEAVAGRAVDPDRPPQVRVLVTRSDRELVVRVGDDGPGLDAEAARLAFERGWSTKPGGDRPQGRGLGLALVGQVVHRAGGTVEVDGSGGATFTVRVPLRDPADAPDRDVRDARDARTTVTGAQP
jgi:sensor histidine kinase regulating citrate/malate metabolism